MIKKLNKKKDRTPCKIENKIKMKTKNRFK